MVVINFLLPAMSINCIYSGRLIDGQTATVPLLMAVLSVIVAVDLLVAGTSLPLLLIAAAAFCTARFFLFALAPYLCQRLFGT